MEGKYIYGIIKGNGKVKFPVKGLLNKRPYAVTYNSISAIITDAPVKTYEADEKGLLSHNRVLDEVMKKDSVLPMRFGTIAQSEEEIRRLLKNAYSALMDILEKIKDKVEFDVVISINDEQMILKDILENNKEIRDFRDKLIAKGTDAQIQDKLMIGKMIAGEVMRHKEDLFKDILKALKPYFKQYKHLSGKAVLANLAFLVNKAKVKEFEAAIYRLGEKYGDKMKFKYAGPLAPYSFVEMKLVLLNFNTVDGARRQLGLSREATLGDIKEVYRKFAQQLHPDIYPGDAHKEKEFKKMTDAYKLLCEYCRYYPKKRYVFKAGEINDFSVLVKDKE